VTGAPARKTYKKAADSARIALGAGDTYEPRCNAAWRGVERVTSRSEATSQIGALAGARTGD
jgi:hypothetical protein